jgi:hypothetical protein
VDKIQRNFEPLQRQVEDWRKREVSDVRAKLLIYEAFVEGGLNIPRHLMCNVHHYFEPEYEEFRPRTFWSLSNAFTSAFKELKPMQQFGATARLGGFLTKGEIELRQFPMDLDVPQEEMLTAAV